MKKNQPYEINPITNTITVTRKFLQAASTMGTPAFDTMMKLKELNMDFVMREIHRKKTGHMWSYKRMEFYLDRVEDSEKYWTEYKALAGNSHAMIWGWFKKTFPYCQRTPVLNEKYQYIVRPSEYENEKRVKLYECAKHCPVPMEMKQSA